MLWQLEMSRQMLARYSDDRRISDDEGSPGGISGIITVGSVGVDSNEDTQVCHFMAQF